MSDLAIYDMDRTVTRHATYTPFLLHCAIRRAPWRLLLLPFVLLSMLAYTARLIDRARLQEINQKSLLSQEDEIEEKKIKLHKLTLKDHMEQILRSHRESRVSA